MREVIMFSELGYSMGEMATREDEQGWPMGALGCRGPEVVGCVVSVYEKILTKEP